MSQEKAFPTSCLNAVGDGHLQEGMDLRDWFAGQVCSGLTARYRGNFPPEEYAREAYRFADAMMEARKDA